MSNIATILTSAHRRRQTHAKWIEYTHTLECFIYCVSLFFNFEFETIGVRVRGTETRAQTHLYDVRVVQIVDRYDDLFAVHSTIGHYKRFSFKIFWYKKSFKITWRLHGGARSKMNFRYVLCTNQD